MNEYADPQPKEATTPARAVPPVVHEVLRSPGQQLDTNTRNAVEPRFGHDFSRVRVHTDAQAAQSAREVDALAYTVGSDVVFGANRYSPETPAGQRLLAHELAHVVQQEGSREDVPETLRLDSPSDAPEKVADEAARVYGATKSDPSGSAALRLRDRLRTSKLPHPALQRAVATWGGEYETDKYDLTKDPGQDGVEIKLRFKPNNFVDAKEIALVQSVRSREKGGSVIIGSGASKTALQSRTIPEGDPGAGTRIDRLSSQRMPLYGTEDPASGSSLAGSSTRATAHHGWRYTDISGTLHKEDAWLHDTPQLFSTRKESSQVFESTALAVAGAQENTFYGSVQWGWEKDAGEKVKKLPLTRVSNDVPSSTFATASELWNKAKTSKGEATIDLPIVAGKYTNTEGASLVGDPAKAKTTIVGKLAKNTRLEVTSKGAAAAFNKGAATQWWRVTVVDGTHTGQVGWVMETMLSDSKTK